MKVLVQDMRTGLYAGRYGGWQPDVGAALVFARLSQAKDYCTLHQLTQARIVALAGGANHDVRSAEPDTSSVAHTEPS